jgi:hypothetical protein
VSEREKEGGWGEGENKHLESQAWAISYGIIILLQLTLRLHCMNAESPHQISPGIAMRSVPADLKVPTVRTPCTLSCTCKDKEVGGK